ncbi:hypothetical protein SC828_09050 [Legionella pneumophila serogroup 1]
MKKISLLFVMMLLNGSIYAVTFCPQTITCGEQNCTGIPKGFFILDGRPKDNTTYYFNHATDGSRVGLGSRVACAYGDITITRNLLRADIDYPGNHWKPTLHEDIYVCRYTSSDCPFK